MSWIAAPETLALRWADRAVRAVAVAALEQGGLTSWASQLVSLAELIDDVTVQAARDTVDRALCAALAESASERVVLALIGAREAVALSTLRTSSPDQLRTLVDVLHLSAHG
jgi:hypothetical protein